MIGYAEEEFRAELAKMRDQVVVGIREGRLRNVQAGLELYAGLAQRAMQRSHELDVRAGDVALLTPFGQSEGRELRWLAIDLSEFLEQAVRVEDDRVFDEVLEVAVDGLYGALALRSVDVVGVYMELLRQGWLTIGSYEVEMLSDGRREALLSRVRLIAEELVRRLWPERSDGLTAEEVGQVGGRIIKLLSDLLKSSVDSRVAKHIEQLSGLLGRIFTPGEFELLERASPGSADDQEVHRLILQLNNLRRVAACGVDGWILFRHGKETLDDYDARELRAALWSGLGGVDLWLTFGRLDEHEMGGFFDWRFWETSTWEGSRAGAIRIGGFVEEAIALRLVEVGSVRASLEVWDGATLRSVDVRSRCDRLLSLVENIRDDRARWERVAIAELTSVDDVAEGIRNARDEALRVEEQELIERPIDQDCVEAFERGVQQARSRDVVPAFGGLIKADKWVGAEEAGNELESRDERLVWIGINRLVPKYFFVHAHVHADPESLARDLVVSITRGEARYIADELLKSLPSAHTSMEELPARVRSALEGLRAGAEKVVVVFGSWEIVRSLEDAERKRGVDVEIPLASFGGAQVIHEVSSNMNVCFVMDVSSLSRLRWKPIDLVLAAVHQEDGRLLVAVQEVTEERAAELVSRDDDFRKDQSGELQEPADAIWRLRQLVQVRVQERVRLDVENPDSGTAIVVDLPGSDE